MLQLLKQTKHLSTTQTMIIDSVRKFCEKELIPRVRMDYKDEMTKAASLNIFKSFGELGILGPTIQGYNCLGETYKTYGLIAKEIEAVDSGYRSMFSVQSSLVMNPIFQFGNDYLKDIYLPSLSSGAFVGCFGLTEPDHGSDPSSMKTTATETNDCFILNGNKTWISNAPIADVFIIWAKNQKTNKINGFVLDRDMDGINTPTIDGKLSLRTSITGMINLDEVKVPKINRLDVEGMRGPFTCLNSARLGISFGVLGAAETCIEKTLDYAQNRFLFGQSLVEKQLVQMKFANMLTEYNLGLLSAMRVAELVDEQDSIPEMISLVKRNSCQKSLDIARNCRDILGGNGISEEYDIFRHMCNLETVNTYEGTYDIHSLILGNHVTGKKAF